MEPASAQYTFAINQHGQLTHIAEACRQDSYRCCDCDDTLIPVQGDIRTHHFRHVQSACSYESYLHKAAKLAFYQRFQQAKSESSPIALGLQRSVVCCSDKASLLQDIGIACVSLQPALYNLTALFDTALLEQFDPDTGLTPDILLSSKEHPARKCYVEINVTHPCSTEKIEKEIPIIEFDVNNETDIDFIKSESFSVSDHRLTLFHFHSPDKEVHQCHNFCSQQERPIGVWALSNTGRLNKETKPLRQLTSMHLDEGNCWSDELDSDQQIGRAYLLLQKQDPLNHFPNCIRCMHCQSWDQATIFCSRKGLNTSYTEARKCMDYEVKV